MEASITMAIAGSPMETPYHMGNGSFNIHMWEHIIQDWAKGSEPWTEWPKGKMRDMLKFGSAKYLSGETKTHKHKLAYTGGGACRNMIPHIPTVDGVIADDDGSGMYVSIMRSMNAPIGIPTTWGKTIGGEQMFTLQSFQTRFKEELVDRMWVAIVNTIEPLDHKQSLIQSKSDDGCDVMLLTQEIRNGVITSDILEAYEAAARKSELIDLKNKCEVIAYAVYKRSDYRETFAEMKRDYKGSSPCIVHSTESETLFQNLPKAWTILPLELIAGPYQTLRREKQRERDDATNPIIKREFNTQQERLKEAGNSVYGGFTSDKFEASNVVVSHNITAAGRAWVWSCGIPLAFKLNITDGGPCNLNEVLYQNKQRMTSMETLTLAHRPDSISRGLRNCKALVGPLGGHRWDISYDDATGETIIQSEGISIRGCKDNWSELNAILKQHCIDFWGERCPSIVKQIDHAVKDVYTSLSIQGQASYLLAKPNGGFKIKARGHEGSKPYSSVIGIDGDEKPNIHELFHYLNKGLPIPPFKPQYKPAMLKSGSWKGSAYQSQGILPCSTVQYTTWLRPLSPSMFQYTTMNQYVAWTNLHNRLKIKTGWGLESFKVSEDGWLMDYPGMVREYQSLIDDGNYSPTDTSSTGRRIRVHESPMHPYRSLGMLGSSLDDVESVTNFDETEHFD
jgi:hypothetical protein